MKHKRNLLFAGASAGAILALAGLLVIIYAWVFPHLLVTDRGTAFSADDLNTGLRVQLLGTLIGLTGTVGGLGLASLCFKVLRRVQDREAGAG